MNVFQKPVLALSLICWSPISLIYLLFIINFATRLFCAGFNLEGFPSELPMIDVFITNYSLSFILMVESRPSIFSSLLLWLQQAGSTFIFSQFSLFSYCHYGIIFDSRRRCVPQRAMNLLCWGLETLSFPSIELLPRRVPEHTLSMNLGSYIRTDSCLNFLCWCWGLSQLIFLAPCQGRAWFGTWLTGYGPVQE